MGWGRGIFWRLAFIELTLPVQRQVKELLSVEVGALFTLAVLHNSFTVQLALQNAVNNEWHFLNFKLERHF